MLDSYENARLLLKSVADYFNSQYLSREDLGIIKYALHRIAIDHSEALIKNPTPANLKHLVLTECGHTDTIDALSILINYLNDISSPFLPYDGPK